LAFVVASTVVASTVVASTVAAFTARAWRWASVLLRSVPLRSVPPLRVLTMAPAIMALPPRSLVDTATIIMRPTTAAYPRHSCCNTGGHRWSGSNSRRSAEQSERMGSLRNHCPKAEHCSCVRSGSYLVTVSVKAPVYYVERTAKSLGSTSVVARDDVRFWGKTGSRGPNVKPTRMTPERTLGPPDQQVTINLCRNCIARRAGWNMFPDGPGDVVMHTV